MARTTPLLSNIQSPFKSDGVDDRDDTSKRTWFKCLPAFRESTLINMTGIALSDCKKSS